MQLHTENDDAADYTNADQIVGNHNGRFARIPLLVSPYLAKLSPGAMWACEGNEPAYVSRGATLRLAVSMLILSNLRRWCISTVRFLQIVKYGDVMAISRFPLSQLQHNFGAHVIDQNSGTQVFHAPSSHSLIQAAGYLKYIRAKKDKKGVFFRGQTRLYPNLGPTLLRGVKDGSQRIKLLNTFLEQLDIEKQALRAVDKHCREALLQHYGIRTTWIDVVDNIWIALWFACHQAKSVSRGHEEYLHFEKRIPSSYTSGDPQYAYVLLLESAFFEPVAGFPGHYRDNKSETIDLRVAAPSQFVRPHAQHGVLVRGLSKKGRPVVDCSALHVGTIRVELAAALDWLGSASTLTSHSLFPPAYYDYGYQELLEFVNPESKTLGFIHRVQA